MLRTRDHDAQRLDPVDADASLFLNLEVEHGSDSRVVGRPKARDADDLSPLATTPELM